jgi:hypothetical protein
MRKTEHKIIRKRETEKKKKEEKKEQKKWTVYRIPEHPP